MATSSITKNFVISGREQVEMFVNAIEESAKNRPVHIPAAAREIKGETELREMMRKPESQHLLSCFPVFPVRRTRMLNGF